MLYVTTSLEVALSARAELDYREIRKLDIWDVLDMFSL